MDEAALVEALRTGRIAGAGLDVFDVEPLPADHPLRTVPRAVLTPHLGYVALDAYRVFYADAVEDIAAWLAGEPGPRADLNGCGSSRCCRRPRTWSSPSAWPATWSGVRTSATGRPAS